MNHDIIIITSGNQLHNTHNYQKMYLNGDCGLVPGDQISVFGTSGKGAIGTVVESSYNGSFIIIEVK